MSLTQSIEIGPILEKALRVLMDNLVPLAVLALVIVGLPSLVLSGELFSEAMLSPGLWIEFSVTGIILMFCQALLVAAVMDATARHLRGEPALSLGAQLSGALPAVVPVVAVALLMAIGIWIGLWLLLLPGLYLMVRWVVAVPVAAIERPGAIASLSRSAALTRGSGWTIFGYIIVIWLLGIVVSWLAGVVFGILGIGALGEAIVQSAFAGYMAIVAVLLYRELRRVRGEPVLDPAALD